MISMRVVSRASHPRLTIFQRMFAVSRNRRSGTAKLSAAAPQRARGCRSHLPVDVPLDDDAGVDDPQRHRSRSSRNQLRGVRELLPALFNSSKMRSACLAPVPKWLTASRSMIAFNSACSERFRCSRRFFSVPTVSSSRSRMRTFMISHRRTTRIRSAWVKSVHRIPDCRRKSALSR